MELRGSTVEDEAAALSMGALAPQTRCELTRLSGSRGTSHEDSTCPRLLFVVPGDQRDVQLLGRGYVHGICTAQAQIGSKLRGCLCQPAIHGNEPESGQAH